MGAQGANKAMGKVLFKPLGRSGLSIIDLARLKDKDKRLQLDSISKSSRDSMTTSQQRLFRNADRGLQNRMIMKNKLRAADTGLKFVGDKPNYMTPAQINAKRTPMKRGEAAKKLFLGLGAG